MPGYSKAQYDADMDVLDELDQLITIKVAAEELGGFDALKLAQEIEYKRRQCKGMLLSVRSRMADRNAKGNCLQPYNHKQACFCKSAVKAELVNKAVA